MLRKSVTSSTRANVNQVDAHRERLGLAPDVPGVLIMIRTLDLLRYADGVEKGVLTKEDFRDALLHKSGWLKVENQTVEVVAQ